MSEFKKPINWLFSAHAEVFPNERYLLSPVRALLRARGGISEKEWQVGLIVGSSPRTRRYFLNALADAGDLELFSAHAEVFPRAGLATRVGAPLLRARGGISTNHFGDGQHPDSSPRTRRYFPGLM